MFRLWCKIFTNNHLVKDTVICDNSDLNRTKKIFNAIEEACLQFDLGRPIWLDSNIKAFRKHSKVKFLADNFIEDIDFDYFEIQVIEED